MARQGVYRAPYVVTTPGERATVIASRGSRSAPEVDQAMVELAPGVFPGAEDCLGPGQQWEPNGCTLAYAPVDELPEAVTTVPPRYPSSARARRLEGRLIVQAIVCKSGRVLDAVAQWGVGVTPVPELEDLAVEAARQWGFKPGLIQGQPVATVVAIPFRFPPP
jgi:TonB family protein